MTHILLVEDNPDNRDMLSRRLIRRGYSVDIAVDGLDAVTQATMGLPDLVLLDLSLPGIDGYEVARRLKAAPATRRIPLIALTAHALVEDRDRSIEAGCDEFETKPVDLARLIQKIDALTTRTV